MTKNQQVSDEYEKSCSDSAFVDSRCLSKKVSMGGTLDAAHLLEAFVAEIRRITLITSEILSSSTYDFL